MFLFPVVLKMPKIDVNILILPFLKSNFMIILRLSSKVQDPNIFKYNEYFFQKTINWYCDLEIR